MAQTLGLTKKQMDAYKLTLAGDHERRVRFHVLDLNGTFTTELSAELDEGEVICDTSSSPTVRLEASFYDPNSGIGFAPDVGEYPIYRRRMLRCFVDVFVPDPSLNRWVACAVFTGPIAAVSREGALVKVVCHDKSAQALGNAWTARTFPKGAKRTSVVRAILEDTGEKSLAVAKGEGRLGKKLEVGKMDRPWVKAKAAMPVGRALFYNSRGVAICRRPPVKSQYTVPKALVLTAPVANREPGQPPNRFQLIGGKPTKNAKSKVRSRPYDLPASNPDNPMPGSGVGRNGKRRIHAKVASNDKIKSQKVANNLARKMRDAAGRSSVDMSFDIVPVPHLEPFDVVTVKTDDGSFRVKLREYRMSLSGGSMVIGSKRAVMPPKRRRRKKDNGKGKK